ncbi:MAG: hypothetical protein GX558_12905 [Clostridiales bacterium]|nr:hypothetical protein [Clostridiales bacterium]
MQKRIFVVLLALAMVFCFSAMALADDFSIKISGAVEEEVVITDTQLAELEQVTATYRNINSGGTVTEAEYTGFKLADLLALAVPTGDIESVTFIAADNYQSKPLMLNAVYLNDLVPIIVLAEGGYQVIVPQVTEDEVNNSRWVKEIVEVKLNVAAAEEEPAEEEPVEEEPAFVIPVPAKVVVSNQALTVDGQAVDVQAYNIDGANYFKLRDLAALLTGSGSQFNVGYEAPNVIVTTGEAYEAIEGDLVKGEDKSASTVPSAQVLKVNGEQVDVLVYNIGGNNYFQLRNLGELLGFAVDYDEATRTISVESAGYVPAEPAEEAPAAAAVTIGGTGFTAEQLLAATAVEGAFTNKKGEEVAYKGVKVADLIEELPAADAALTLTTWDNYPDVPAATGADLAEAVIMFEVGGAAVANEHEGVTYQFQLLIAGQQVKLISVIAW